MFMEAAIRVGVKLFLEVFKSSTSIFKYKAELKYSKYLEDIKYNSM